MRASAMHGSGPATARSAVLWALLAAAASVCQRAAASGERAAARAAFAAAWEGGVLEAGVSPYVRADGEVGLRADRASPVAAGEDLLSIPSRLTLSAGKALASELGQAVAARAAEASEARQLPLMEAGFVLGICDLALAAAVLAVKGGVGEPALVAYVRRAVPHVEPPNLFAWGSDELNELHDPEAAAFASGEAAVVRAAHAHVLLPVSQMRPDLLPPEAVDEASTTWAWGVVASRTVPAPAEILPEVDDPVQGPRPDTLLLPLLDLANHDHAGQALELRLEGSSYVWSAARGVAAGAELTLCYAPQPNKFLLFKYGLADPRNPFEAAQVLLTAPRGAAPLAPLAQTIVEACIAARDRALGEASSGGGSIADVQLTVAQCPHLALVQGAPVQLVLASGPHGPLPHSALAARVLFGRESGGAKARSHFRRAVSAALEEPVSDLVGRTSTSSALWRLAEGEGSAFALRAVREGCAAAALAANTSSLEADEEALQRATDWRATLMLVAQGEGREEDEPELTRASEAETSAGDRAAAGMIPIAARHRNALAYRITRKRLLAGCVERTEQMLEALSMHGDL
mmetsp:Transcript_22420/g.76150  ORF Transcript_22420/g.76150 Transcript_22420/m.76150 type:complete len:576 (-) Transcript_22420:4442-6169(-)